MFYLHRVRLEVMRTSGPLQVEVSHHVGAETELGPPQQEPPELSPRPHFLALGSCFVPRADFSFPGAKMTAVHHEAWLHTQIGSVKWFLL